MEFFDLVIIILVREVFLFEILIGLFPLQSPITDPLYSLEVFPPNGALPFRLNMATLAFMFPE